MKWAAIDLSFIGVVAFMGACVLVSCLPSPARIETAHAVLNALTEVVDPSYEAARIGCKAADDAAIALARADAITLAELDTRVAKSREACDKVFHTYEEIIRLQQTARATLDAADGDEQALSEAEALIRKMRELWGKRP